MTQLPFLSALQNGESLALPLWLPRPTTPFNTCIQLSKPTGCRIRILLSRRSPCAAVLRWIPTANRRRITSAHSATRLGSMYYTYGALSAEWERIPAETAFGRKRVLHILAQERVDQTRGRPVRPSSNNSACSTRTSGRSFKARSSTRGGCDRDADGPGRDHGTDGRRSERLPGGERPSIVCNSKAEPSSRSIPATR